MACPPPKAKQKATTEPPQYGLKVGAFRLYRRWSVDNIGREGYADNPPHPSLALDEEARAYLERFNREYHDADNRQLKALDALHYSKRLRRDCYARQNAAFRDVYSRGMVDVGYVEHSQGRSLIEKDESFAKANHFARDARIAKPDRYF